MVILNRKNKIDKREKLVGSPYNKKNYVIQISTLKQPLDNRLILENVHRSTELSHEAWLKAYINVNSEQKQSMILRTSSW